MRELLTTTVFRSAEGYAWKRDGDNETYAATTQARFSIVPKGYQAGFFPVNELSCNRCHEDTGRQIGEFNFKSLLYGEVWGEDRIFTWHPFDASGNFYGAFHNNRIMNRKFEAAGLIERYDASRHPSTVYRELPRRFQIIWR